MSLRITKVANHAATVESEQVAIAVDGTVNLGDYELIDNTYHKDGTLSNIHPHPYRFPRQEVKKGDTVIVHTGIGANSANRLVNSTTTTFHYYRNSKESFWNDSGDVARIYKRQLVSELSAPAKPANPLRPILPPKTFSPPKK